MKTLPLLVGLLAISAAFSTQVKLEDVKPVYESAPGQKTPVDQSSNSCSSGCYRCYSYSNCYQCYSGYYLSNGYCYRQNGSSSSGGVSWLTIICCIICCGGCCFGGARLYENHAHEVHHHDNHAADYHHHHCPEEVNHHRELQNMHDHHGNPMMTGPQIHGYNPPVPHLQGQHYTPPPPLFANQAPYAPPQYAPIPPYPAHPYPADPHNSNMLPPGFATASPVYPNTPLPVPPAQVKDSSYKPVASKGLDYPSMVDQKESMDKSKSALDTPTKSDTNKEKVFKSEIVKKDDPADTKK